MSVFEVHYDFYNPRSPKCRACEYWGSGETDTYYADCTNANFKGQKMRAHNAKACVNFRRSRNEN